MPASGPVENAKMFPAATLDDQEAIMTDEGEGTVLGTPPFSSPDPVTDGVRMLPLEDGSSAHRAAVEAAEARGAGQDYSKLKVADLRTLAEQRDLNVEGLKKDEIVAKLQEDDASDLKASDFVDKVNAATTQDELNEVAELYDSSGKEYATVEAAFDKKQTELDES